MTWRATSGPWASSLKDTNGGGGVGGGTTCRYTREHSTSQHTSALKPEQEEPNLKQEEAAVHKQGAGVRTEVIRRPSPLQRDGRVSVVNGFRCGTLLDSQSVVFRVDASFRCFFLVQQRSACPPTPSVPWVPSKCHLSKLCIGVGGGEDRAPLSGAWLMDVTLTQLVLPPSLKRSA